MESKGDGKGRWVKGKEGKGKEAVQKRFNKIHQKEINEVLYQTAWMEAAAYFLRRY